MLAAANISGSVYNRLEFGERDPSRTGADTALPFPNSVGYSGPAWVIPD